MEGEEIVYSDPQPVEYLLNYDIISIAVGDHHSVALSSRGFSPSLLEFSPSFSFFSFLIYFFPFVLSGHVFVWGQNIRRTLTGILSFLNALPYLYLVRLFSFLILFFCFLVFNFLFLFLSFLISFLLFFELESQTSLFWGQGSRASIYGLRLRYL